MLEFFLGLPKALGHEWLSAISSTVVAFFTIVLAWVGWRQASIIRGQQRLQRAYLFGGCGETWLITEHNGQPALSKDGFRRVGFRPGCRNYGQTPAWVLRAVCVFCPDPPPKRPNYKPSKNAHHITFIISDSIPPDGNVYKPFGHTVEVEMTAPKLILYGRIYYRDMLRRRRHTSFIYRLKGRWQPRAH